MARCEFLRTMRAMEVVARAVAVLPVLRARLKRLTLLRAWPSLLVVLAVLRTRLEWLALLRTRPTLIVVLATALRRSTLTARAAGMGRFHRYGI